MPRLERSAILQGTIRNDGYVVRTLEAALWAFGRSTSFEEGCLMVVNLGGDADTVAAVYGQVHILFILRQWRDNYKCTVVRQLMEMDSRHQTGL